MHERMWNPFESLQYDLIPGLDQLARISLAFIPQRIAPSRIDNSARHPPEIRCIERIGIPFNLGYLLRLDHCIIRNTLPLEVIEPLESCPVQRWRVLHLFHRGEWAIGCFFVLRNVIDYRCADCNQARGDACVASQMSEN